MADDEQYDDEQVLDENIRAELRKSREREQRAKDAEAKSAELERELAFAKAGIPDSPLTAALAKTYEGENDPASVKAYFEGLGVDLSGDQQAQQDQSNEAELAEQRRLAQVGSQGGTGGDVRYEDAINSAKNVDEVMALLSAAPEGATDYEGRRIGAPTIE